MWIWTEPLQSKVLILVCVFHKLNHKQPSQTTYKFWVTRKKTECILPRLMSAWLWHKVGASQKLNTWSTISSYTCLPSTVHNLFQNVTPGETDRYYHHLKIEFFPVNSWLRRKKKASEAKTTSLNPRCQLLDVTYGVPWAMKFWNCSRNLFLQLSAVHFLSLHTTSLLQFDYSLD